MTGAEPRYLAVAGSCAVMHNLIMIVGNLLGVHYLSSSVVSFVLVALTGYVLHAHFTFRTSPSARSLLRYALAMAGNYPLSIALLFVLCDLLGTSVMLAAPLATGILICCNFLLSQQALTIKLLPRGSLR